MHNYFINYQKHFMKMKIVNICWVLICFISVCFAQGKFGNQWIVYDMGLNFNHKPSPKVDTSIQFRHTLFQKFTLSDYNGNLVCYGGTPRGGYDIMLFNKFDTFLKGMETIIQPTVRFTQFSTNNLAILPFSNNVDTLMLIQFSRWNSMYKHRLMYSLIDTKAYSDTGCIFSSNNTVLKFTGVFGILGCIRHANGRDWWILTHGFPNNKFYKFLATPWKVELVGEQCIGSEFIIRDEYFSGNDRIGDCCVNEQGTQICINKKDGFIEVYNFDRCSGILSNPVTILRNSNCKFTTMSFSPSGRFLYCIFTVEPNDTTYKSQLVQFDLQNTDPDHPDSTILYSYQPGKGWLEGLKIGPDGKLWITGSPESDSINTVFPQDSFLHFIEYPDIKGHACNLKFNQIYLNGRRGRGEFPRIPNYNLGLIEESKCDSLKLPVSVQYMDTIANGERPAIFYNHYLTRLEPILNIPYPAPDNRVTLYDSTDKLIWSGPCETEIRYLPNHFPPGKYRVEISGIYGTSSTVWEKKK